MKKILNLTLFFTLLTIVVLGFSQTNNFNTLDSTGSTFSQGISTTKSISGSSSTGAFGYGTLSYADINNFGAFQASANSYAQWILQNTNSGATASTDYVVSNDAGTATTFYGNFGMNSSGFTGTGSFNQPSYVYLTSTSSDLAIGTTTSNGIHFVVNGGATDAMAISSAGAITTSGNATNTGTGALINTVTTTDNTTSSAAEFAATSSGGGTNKPQTLLIANAQARATTRYGITIGGMGEILVAGTAPLGLLIGNGANNVPVYIGSNNLVSAQFQGGLVTFPNITSDATHTDASLCEDTTTHGMYSGSGTLGICLGTSSARFKNKIRDQDDALWEVMQLRPRNFFYNKDSGDRGAREQYGFVAEEYAKVLPKLTHMGKDGKPMSVDILGLVPVLTKAIQQQQYEIFLLAALVFIQGILIFVLFIKKTNKVK